MTGVENLSRGRRSVRDLRGSKRGKGDPEEVSRNWQGGNMRLGSGFCLRSGRSEDGPGSTKVRRSETLGRGQCDGGKGSSGAEAGVRTSRGGRSGTGGPGPSAPRPRVSMTGSGRAITRVYPTELGLRHLLPCWGLSCRTAKRPADVSRLRTGLAVSGVRALSQGPDLSIRLPMAFPVCRSALSCLHFFSDCPFFLLMRQGPVWRFRRRTRGTAGLPLVAPVQGAGWQPMVRPHPKKRQQKVL